MSDSADIAFYVLEDPSEKDVLTLACRVIDKAFRAGLRVFVRAADSDQARQLDDLLWTFSQGSFVPHSTDEAIAEDPVIVGHRLPLADDRWDAIVTLHAEPLPPAFHHLKIADIIGAGERGRREARTRYRQYRDSGIAPQTHRL